MKKPDGRQLDRVANEVLELIGSGIIRLRRGDTTAGTIPVGAVPLLLALSLLPLERRVDCLLVKPNKGEILRASGLAPTVNGTFSRKQRETLVCYLQQLNDLRIIKVLEPVSEWKHGRLPIQLMDAYFGGLRQGGHGFSVVDGNRLQRTIRKALQPETRCLCAIPLICFLLRQQSRDKKGYRPRMVVTIGQQPLLDRLGFHGSNPRRKVEALQAAFRFLQSEGVLDGAPRARDAVFGTGEVLVIRKASAFFAPTRANGRTSPAEKEPDAGDTAPLNPILVNPSHTAGQFKAVKRVNPILMTEPET